MNVPQMREYIKDAYPGKEWQRRCDSMPKDQVIAVYYSIVKRRGKKKKLPKPEGKQITIWEYMQR